MLQETVLQQNNHTDRSGMSFSFSLMDGNGATFLQMRPFNIVVEKYSGSLMDQVRRVVLNSNQRPATVFNIPHKNRTTSEFQTPSIAVPEAARGSYCLCYKAASVRRSKGPFDAIEAYLKNYFVRGDEYFDVIVWFISGLSLSAKSFLSNTPKEICLWRVPLKRIV